MELYQSPGGIELNWSTKGLVLGLLRKTKPRLLTQMDELSFGEPEARRENIIIEGDNLQVMASLHKYKERIDLIYTDPPYNTGTPSGLFRYNDRWLQDPNDPDPGDLVDKTDGSRHTKWLSFMLPRLDMMKRMLKPNGVIAISIDERELFFLGVLMDSVFEEKNRIGIINWQKKYASSSQSSHLSPATEYVLVYAKNKDIAKTGLLQRTTGMDARYTNPDNDPDGQWGSDNAIAKDKEAHKSAHYGIQSPFTGEMLYPGGSSQANSHWRYEKKDMKKWLEGWGSKYEEVHDPNCYAKSLVLQGSKMVEGKVVTSPRLLAKARERAEKVKQGVWPKLYFLKDGLGRPRIKRHHHLVKEGRVPMTFWEEEEYLTAEEIGSQSWGHKQSGHSDEAKKMLANIMGVDHNYETVKPLMLIEKIIQLWCPPNGIVLDPFAGSGTTAHAVLSINKKVGTTRKFILIEQGDAKNNDLFARTLTAERTRRVISGKWAKPPKGIKPLGGGFNFKVANGPVDAEAILSMERSEVIDLICHADWDRTSRKGGDWVERIEGRGYKYLIAKNRNGQGVCLIWNGANKDATVTREVFEQAYQEIKQAGLRLPLRFYGKRSTFEIDDMQFLQIPDEILMQLGIEGAR